MSLANISPIWYFIFPLVLALIILVLVLVLIAQLRKDMSTSRAKQFADKHMIEIDERFQEFNANLIAFGTKVDEKIASANELNQRLQGQLTTLNSYSEDLSVLKQAMATYHTALSDLRDLTMQTNAELDNLKSRYGLFDQINSTFDEFNKRFEAINEKMNQNELTLDRMMTDFQGTFATRINNYDGSVSDRLAESSQNLDSQLVGFETRMANDIKQFEIQMDTRIDDFHENIVNDVNEHEMRIAALKEESLNAVSQKIDESLRSSIQSINDSYSSFTEATKLLCAELAKRSTEITVAQEAYDTLNAQAIEKINQRLLRISDEESTLARIEAAKNEALRQIDELHAQKLELETALAQKIQAQAEPLLMEDFEKREDKAEEEEKPFGRFAYEEDEQQDEQEELVPYGESEEIEF